MGPRNHVLDGVHGKGQFGGGRGGPLLSVGTLWGELCKKRLNRSKCRLGFGLGGWAEESRAL